MSSCWARVGLSGRVASNAAALGEGGDRFVMEHCAGGIVRHLLEIAHGPLDLALALEVDELGGDGPGSAPWLPERANALVELRRRVGPSRS